MNSPSHSLHRRTLLKGSAWVAPAIVVAAAAPRVAASAIPLVSSHGRVTTSGAADSLLGWLTTGSAARGNWVDNVPANVTVTSFVVTLWLKFQTPPTAISMVSSTSSDWSNPVLVSDAPPPTAAGYSGIQTIWTGNPVAPVNGTARLDTFEFSFRAGAQMTDTIAYVESYAVLSNGVKYTHGPRRFNMATST